METLHDAIQYQSSGMSFDLIDSAEHKTSYGPGHFYLTTQKLHFENSQGTWELLYEEIGLHALSRDPANFGGPCIYCQPATEDLTQWVFTPHDPDSLSELFEVFTRCAALAPAPESDEDSEFFTGL